MTERSASCSCGAVRCAIEHDVQTVVNCHCTLCRKMNGGAFSTMVVIPTEKVAFHAGEESLQAYALSEAVSKRFCGRCGTPLFNVNARIPGFSMFYLGALDGADDLVPSMNVFCSTKLGWVDALGDIASFDGVPEA